MDEGDSCSPGPERDKRNAVSRLSESGMAAKCPGMWHCHAAIVGAVVSHAQLHLPGLRGVNRIAAIYSHAASDWGIYYKHRQGFCSSWRNQDECCDIPFGRQSM